MKKAGKVQRFVSESCQIRHEKGRENVFVKRETDMKRIYAISFISTIAVIIVAALFQFLVLDKRTQKHIKVGFVYVGDTSTVIPGTLLKRKMRLKSSTEIV